MIRINTITSSCAHFRSCALMDACHNPLCIVLVCQTLHALKPISNERKPLPICWHFHPDIGLVYNVRRQKSYVTYFKLSRKTKSLYFQSHLDEFSVTFRLNFPFQTAVHWNWRRWASNTVDGVTFGELFENQLFDHSMYSIYRIYKYGSWRGGGGGGG
jgi:hypothetical protein